MSLSEFIWSVADLLRGDYKQFANSPDIANGISNSMMEVLSARSTMSKQALNSERVRDDLKDALLGPAQLYESLRWCCTAGNSFTY